MVVISDGLPQEGISTVVPMVGVNETDSVGETAYEIIALTSVAVLEHCGPLGK